MNKPPLFILTLLLLQSILVSAAPGDSVPVRIKVPEIGSVQWIERTTGELLAPRRAILKMKIDGIFEKIPVKEGDRVTQGQVLAVLDMTDANISLDLSTNMAKAIETQVTSAKAALESSRVGKRQAEIRLDTATRDFERAKNLLLKETIHQQQFDQMEGQFLLAKNGVEASEKQIVQAQAALEATKSQLGVSTVGIHSSRQRITDSTLIAPFNGLIAAKTMMDHEQSKEQTITLIDDSELELVAHLPERLLPVVSVGTPVSLRSPLLGEPIQTRISTIIPAIDSKTLSFLIKAAIPNTELRLSHGGYVDVEVIVREDSQVPIVPVETVKTAPLAGNADPNSPRSGFVFTVREGRARKTPVTVGLSRNNQTSILSGLASGVPIIILGTEQLEDGTLVKETATATEETHR
ncbi:MAG: efflux RND transporter periplasmic adaptor subunit [Candidatus Ozemobacteraceae bacterium]